MLFTYLLDSFYFGETVIFVLLIQGRRKCERISPNMDAIFYRLCSFTDFNDFAIVSTVLLTFVPTPYTI